MDPSDEYPKETPKSKEVEWSLWRKIMAAKEKAAKEARERRIKKTSIRQHYDTEK